MIYSSFLSIDQYFRLVIFNAENSTLLKHIMQNGRSVFRAISEIVGNSILIPSQNSLNNLYYIFYLFMCLPQCSCGGQRTAARSWFSHPTVRVPIAVRPGRVESLPAEPPLSSI